MAWIWISFILVPCTLLTLVRLASSSNHILPKESGYSYKRDNPQSNNKLLSFTKSEVEILRETLPMIGIENSPLQSIYQLIQSSEDGLEITFDDILEGHEAEWMEMITTNEEYRRMYFRQDQPVPQPTEESKRFRMSDSNFDVEDIPDLESRDQTLGYEGCKLDYDMLILPETQGFLRDLCLRLINTLPPLLLPPECQVPIEVPEANPLVRNMIDAHARRPAGLYTGGLHWVGMKHECELVGVNYTWVNMTGGTPSNTERRVFKGMYARLDMPLIEILGITNFTTLIQFAFGVCVPDTCLNEDVARYITTDNQVLIDWVLGGPLFKRNITFIYSGHKLELRDDTPAFIVVICAIVLLIVILIATCYDAWGRERIITRKITEGAGWMSGKQMTPDIVKDGMSYLYNAPSFAERLETGFAGFSVFSNLWQIYGAKQPSFHVPALDGLKAISYMWLVTSLSRAFGIVYFETLTTKNLIQALPKFLGDWTIMPILRVSMANSTLFFISGFLCVQMWYKMYHRNGNRVSFWMFLRYFMHRYWSIMPTMMGILIIYTWFYKYLSDGPIMSPQVTDAEKCKSTWWLPLLLFNNLFKLETQCFAFAWMYSTVWQLYVASIVVVLPLLMFPTVGYVMAALMYIAHIVSTGIWEKKVIDGEKGWFFDIQMTPWCQAGPWVIGMVCAMILKAKQKNFKMHWAPVLILWLCSIAAILASVFTPWDRIKPERDGRREWTDNGKIAFNVISPQMMALGVAWITFACSTGYGGVVGNLLNWKFFLWFSRMMIPQTMFMGALMQQYMMARYDLFYVHENHLSHLGYGNLVRIWIFGTIFAILFTYPASRGIITAVRSQTRMELFLWARHPKILDDFTGEWDRDREQIEEMIAKKTKVDTDMFVGRDPPPTRTGLRRIDKRQRNTYLASGAVPVLPDENGYINFGAIPDGIILNPDAENSPL